MKTRMGTMCVLACSIGALTLAACSTAPKSVEGKADIERDAVAALERAERTDPSLTPIFNRAEGYAIFPTVGKGAVGVGGAYGKGVLYDRGRAVGYCDLTQGTIGLQLGGQSYTEIIAFETRDALTRFKEGNFRFAAQASAVAVKAGAGAATQFTDGVAVFTMDEAGLMYEASIGGQKFSYQPK